MAVCDPVGGMHSMFAGTLAEHVFVDRPPAGFGWGSTTPMPPTWSRCSSATHMKLAAVIIEPVVQGAGGMHFYSPAVLELLRRLCDRYDVLLIFDEIATGFGRTGALFAGNHAEVAPDVMCVGKALSGGYLPLAATLCSAPIAEAISRGEGGALMHGPTFMANPLACAVALASTGLLADGAWRDEVARIERGLTDGLAPARGLPGVTDVRVLGAIGVIQLNAPRRHDRRDRCGSRPWGVAAAVPRPHLHHATVRDRRRRPRADRSRRRGGGTDRTMTDIAATLADLRRDGLYRQRRVIETAPGPRVSLDGNEVLLLCSNDYLGLAADPAVRAAAADAAERWGAGAGASPLISGHMAIHRELEAELAAFKGREACVLFGSGFLANVGVISALAGPGDLILSDALNHASLIEGCRLARAETIVYDHCDLDALAAGLGRAAGRSPLIVTDAVFSMDGDLAPLAGIIELAQRHRARVMIDEAHATGVVGPGGRGLLSALGAEREVDVIVGTLGKALGSYGAFVCCDRPMAEFLVNRARTLIYSTALPPPSVAAALTALRLVRSEPTLVQRLRRNARLLRRELADRGFEVTPGEMPIVPIIVGEPREATALCAAALADGVFVQAIRPPTVPEHTSRLRAVTMATHTETDLRDAAAALAHAALADTAKPAIAPAR